MWKDDKKLVVTDFTRFQNGKICLAGLLPTERKCIRLLPYKTPQEWSRLRVVPGVEILINYKQKDDAKPPHVEDCWHGKNKVRFLRRLPDEEFLRVLERSLSPSVPDGLCCKFHPASGGCVSLDPTPSCSLITIEPEPNSVEIIKWDTKPRISFRDKSGHLFKARPLNGLDLYDLVCELDFFGVAELNEFICSQKRVLMRVGLTRTHEDDNGVRGYWTQVNGLYTFPEQIDSAEFLNN